MKQVILTRDLKPYQAEHTYAFPDALADQLIAEGDAKPATSKAGDVALAPDVSVPAAPPAKPRTRYLTRGAHA